MDKNAHIYNTRDCSFGAGHNNKCIKENRPEDMMAGKYIQIIRDGPNRHPNLRDAYSNENLDQLIAELKKIGDSADWDISFNGTIRFSFKRKHEHLFDAFQEKANMMGYKFFD